MSYNPAIPGDTARKKHLAIAGVTTLVLGLVTFPWLLFHLYEMYTDLPGVMQFELSDYADYLIGIGYLLMLLFHAAAFIFLFIQVRFMRRFGGWRAGSLALGIISLFAIAVEKVMFDEIGRELTVGQPVPGETLFLYGAFIVNMIFCAAMMLTVYRALVQTPSPVDAPSPKDERVFTLAQVMGIVSGITGLLLTFSFIGRRPQALWFWITIPFYLLFLVPYALAVMYWLSMKWRERPTEWYDEKQMRDMMKASLTTLILSVPGLAILVLLQQPLYCYWFPYYVFMALSLFSVSTLYYFKRG